MRISEHIKRHEGGGTLETAVVQTLDDNGRWQDYSRTVPARALIAARTGVVTINGKRLTARAVDFITGEVITPDHVPATDEPAGTMGGGRDPWAAQSLATMADEPADVCPSCGEGDACQGHDELTDPAGYATTVAHVNGVHSSCHHMSACTPSRDHTHPVGSSWVDCLTLAHCPAHCDCPVNACTAVVATTDEPAVEPAPVATVPDGWHPLGECTTVRLFGWDTDWTSCATTVRALLFGELLKRAQPVVREFLSDLYHDARWLDECVNGPATFEWLVRHSGTNVGESARVAVSIGAGAGHVLYRVELTSDTRGEWSVTFTTLSVGA